MAARMDAGTKGGEALPLHSMVGVRLHEGFVVLVLGCGSPSVAPGSAGGSGGSDPGSDGGDGSSSSSSAPVTDASSGLGDSTSGADASSAGSSTGTSDASEFCTPQLGVDAVAWRAEYDVLFADKASMRSYLDALPSGSGHWSQTYTLRSFVLMYELTGELEYLHELIWQAHRLEELAVDGVTWPTGVCGNTFVHPTVVIDARFVEPLLRGAWWMEHSRLADDPVPPIDDLDLGGDTYADVAGGIAELASAVLAGHEPDLRSIAAEAFGPHEGQPSEYYRFPASYDCVAGELMPFNYANSAGSAYAALWHLTGDASAREHAERLMTFWWNRTYAHEPRAGASLSRWWGYRGSLTERFDPDAFPGDDDHRPEDAGHADMSSSFAALSFALGLEGQNGTRIDQVALASKRWIDRAVADGTAPSYYITNDDTNGEWRDLFDHLPMACWRSSILTDLAALAPLHLTDAAGDFRRSEIENLAELAYLSEYSATLACGPRCGDGTCNGPEDCVGCPEDCGPCPSSC
jgi:hypothetical protein